jgi:hypothetical protein
MHTHQDLTRLPIRINVPTYLQDATEMRPEVCTGYEIIPYPALYNQGCSFGRQHFPTERCNEELVQVYREGELVFYKRIVAYNFAVHS